MFTECPRLGTDDEGSVRPALRRSKASNLCHEWSKYIFSICLKPSSSSTDSGSEHELFIAKFRLTLKKIGKTTRPFRSDLNQIPYDYTVEVTNKFNGLDPVNRVPEELWTEVHNIVHEAVTKTIPKKKKCKKAKWLFEEDLQTTERRREAKGKGERE